MKRSGDAMALLLHSSSSPSSSFFAMFILSDSQCCFCMMYICVKKNTKLQQGFCVSLSFEMKKQRCKVKEGRSLEGFNMDTIEVKPAVGQSDRKSCFLTIKTIITATACGGGRGPGGDSLAGRSITAGKR